MQRKILIYSIPFGFGPAGKAIILANHLMKKHHVHITSFNHSLHLLEKSTYGMNVFNCHSRNIEEWNTSLFEDIDIFISVMDLQVIRSVKIKYPHVKTIFIDSLLTWRIDESLTNFLESFGFIDFYIAQYFPDIENHILHNKISDKIYIVSPLIDKDSVFKNKNSVDDCLLIHYGGVSSPVVTLEQYLPFLEKNTEIIIKEFYKKNKLVFAGNIELMRYLSNVFNSFSNVVFDCFSHSNFQYILSRSRGFVTTPGVESSYESFFWRKPTLFLPPINSTQLHQVKKFSDIGFLSAVTKLGMDTFQDIDDRDIEYGQKTLELCNLCNKLSSEKRYQEIIVSDIYDLIGSEKAIYRTLDKQERIVPSNLEDGLCLLEKIIEE